MTPAWCLDVEENHSTRRSWSFLNHARESSHDAYARWSIPRPQSIAFSIHTLAQKQTNNNSLLVLLSLVTYLDRFSLHALVASICLFGPFAWSCAHLGRAFSGELLHGLTPIPPHTIYEVFTCRSPNYPPSLLTFFPSTKTIILRHTSTILLPLLILNDENSPTTDHEHVSQTVFKLFPNTSSNMHSQWLYCIPQREFSRI